MTSARKKPLHTATYIKPSVVNGKTDHLLFGSLSATLQL